MMQKIAIIASSKDPAGINIRNNLLELFDFKKLNLLYGYSSVGICLFKNVPFHLV